MYRLLILLMAILNISSLITLDPQHNRVVRHDEVSTRRCRPGRGRLCCQRDQPNAKFDEKLVVIW